MIRVQRVNKVGKNIEFLMNGASAQGFCETFFKKVSPVWAGHIKNNVTLIGSFFSFIVLK